MSSAANTNRKTAASILAMKAAQQPVTCITAYDFPFAQLVDAAGIDLVLIGDSLGNVIQGHAHTLPVTLEAIEYHTRIVAKGVKHAMVVADMPFGSYQESPSQAVASAVRLVKAGAHGVKVEGTFREAIEAIVRCGIPVMGHVGMTPQFLHAFGGFKVQGKGDDGARVLQDAHDVEQAGAFSMVLELIPSELAEEITKSVSVPTIGIGAGPHCDGQIQVLHDMLGFGEQDFRHVKRYANLRSTIIEAVGQYVTEVRNREFPQ